MSNALKYSPPDRPVTVGVALQSAETALGGEAPAAAVVCVHDGGPGLPLEEQEHIWDRFHRAAGIEVQSGAGIGLGLDLYIVRELIVRHNGRVGVKSAPGTGAEFWFSIPLAPASPTLD